MKSQQDQEDRIYKYLMQAKEFLIERVVNLWTPEQRAKYADQIWHMLQKSYASKGGFLSAESAEELVNTPGYWKIVRRGSDITAANLYRYSTMTDNFKGYASAAETEFDTTKGEYRTTPRGIKDYNQLKREDIRFKRSWAEVSGGPEIMLKRAGAFPISNKFAAMLTGKEILDLNPDGFHYTRLIQGKPHEKVIYGWVKLSEKGLQALKQLGLTKHDLSSNISPD